MEPRIQVSGSLSELRQRCLSSKNTNFTGKTQTSINIMESDPIARPHRGKKKFKCRTCLKKFSSDEVLELHALVHRDEPRGKHKRERKPPPPPTPEHSNDQYTIIITEAHRIFQCNTCRREFDSKAKIHTHMQAHRTEEYVCDICKKTKNTKSALSLHLKTHEPKLYECDSCSKAFATVAQLEKHSLMHNPGMLKHVCHVCFHTFQSLYHLEKHIVTHEKEGINIMFDQAQMLSKLQDSSMTRSDCHDSDETSIKVVIVDATHKCYDCGQVFLRPHELAEHRKTHSGVKSNYMCDICNKDFKLSYYLKLHMRTHTGEKPYECDLCGKKFVTSSKLSRHVKTHEGVREHQCPRCYKFYTNMSYMRTHLRICKANDSDFVNTSELCQAYME